MSGRLQIGDEAPDFSLPDANGDAVSLRTYRGRKVLVYFYPAAGTPGCTKQACDFSENLADLSGAGYDVLGISPDPVAKLAKFAKDQRLTGYGLNFLQIDDQWQVARRDFTSHNPKGPYPGGMKKTADAIKAPTV